MRRCAQILRVCERLTRNAKNSTVFSKIGIEGLTYQFWVNLGTHHRKFSGEKNGSWHEGDQNICRFGENYSPPQVNIKIPLPKFLFSTVLSSGKK